MVGKTPQVREIVYNVLDDSGERTVIAKGATTVDVGDTRELFTRTSNLEAFTTNNFSNISVAQSNILQLEYTLGGALIGGGIQNIYSPLLLTLQSDHADNVDRIEVLEEVHLSNSLIVSNNFSNITILQEIVDSNVGRIDGIVADQLSNAVILSGTFSNVSNIQTELLSNVGRIEDLETDIGAIVNYGDITSLQSSVTDLIDRVTSTIVRVGEDAGTGAPGGTSVSIGNNTGTNIGNNSIAIGAQAQNLTDSVEGNQTLNSIVINATGQLLKSTRRDTLVIAPIQTDDSNTINIMGYNDLTKEVVQSTLLRGIDGNVHATTNISVNNDTILFETNGNGSFGGDIEIAGTLEVGGTSSFTGALQVDDTLEIADTSSFGGDMTIDANAFVYGQSFAMYDGTTENIYIRNDGNASFQGHLEVATIDCNTDIDVYGSFRMKDTNESLHAYINKDGESSFAGKMQIQDELIVEGHSSFVGGIKVLSTSSFGGPVIVNNTSSFTGVANFENDISMTGQNFEMIDTDFSKKINISRDGNASFQGHLEVDTIDCNTDIDVFGSFRMKDTNDSLYATINSDGTSSFARKMQINNHLDVDGTLDIKTDGVSRITLTPAGENTSTVDVLGELRLYNNPNSKNIDLKGSDGTGSFGSTVTCGGFVLGNAIITKSATAARTYTIPNVANSDFVMTKGDQSISGIKEFSSAITGSMSKSISPGTDLSGFSYNGSTDRTFNVVSSTGNDVNTIVKRDASGNFSAGTITGSMSKSISPGTDLSGFSYNGSTDRTFNVVSSTGNDVNTIVKRDASGNFSAGTITATISGTVSSLSNHDTNDLAEGTSNKYFTTQRVIDALITPGNIRLGYAAGETGQQDFAVAIGLAAGKSGQGDFAVAVGRLAGYLSQGDSTVAIGDTAGETKQGNYSIAIG